MACGPPLGGIGGHRGAEVPYRIDAEATGRERSGDGSHHAVRALPRRPALPRDAPDGQPRLRAHPCPRLQKDGLRSLCGKHGVLERERSGLVCQDIRGQGGGAEFQRGECCLTGGCSAREHFNSIFFFLCRYDGYRSTIEKNTEEVQVTTGRAHGQERHLPIRGCMTAGSWNNGVEGYGSSTNGVALILKKRILLTQSPETR